LIEDPIEFLHRDDKSSVSQREVGIDTRGFADALCAALRQDPDVILVGENRDEETLTGYARVSSTTNGGPQSLQESFGYRHKAEGRSRDWRRHTNSWPPPYAPRRCALWRWPARLHVE
jgi:hypothetical protein